MHDADDSIDDLLRAVAAAPAIPLASELGERFALIRRIGEGAFGVVYEAEDRRAGKRVALKMLRDPRADWIHRLKREFRALCDIRHPNLVALEELFCVDDRWFFTMELIDGHNIVDYTRSASRTTPFDERKLRSTFRQLMTGLAAFHATGRVHRDVKPSNIMVTRDGRVVLLDFGLVTDLRARDETASAIVGTPAYMAPEQAIGRGVTAAADQYAAGVVLYEMLVGSRPTAVSSTIDTDVPTATDATLLAAGPASTALVHRAAFPAGCPEDLVTLCLALTDRDPATRPTAEAVALALRDVSEPLPRIASAPVIAPAFVGREREFAQLTEAVAAVERGELTTVFVRGESGIGKSSLVRRFLETFRGSATRLVFAGRCYEKEAVPFQAFDEIVDAMSEYLLYQNALDVAELVPRHAAQLRLLFPVLGRVDAFDRKPISRRDTADPAELRHDAFLALREMLACLGDRHTVILHIDDFQWADQDSIQLLAKLLAPPDPPRLLVVVTSRQPVDLAELGIAGRIETIELGPLDRANAELLISLATTSSPPVAVESLLDEARGHPYFLLELARHRLRSETRATLDDAIWERASEEEPAALRILKLVCLSGVPIEPAALRATAGLPAQDYNRHCDHLTRESLIRTSAGMLVPYHDRVREAVVARLAGTELRELHARLAGVFADRGELAQQVHHLEASGQEQEAARVAIAAGREARDGLGFEQAIAFFRYALRLGAFAPAERGELLMEYGATLAAVGKGFEAAEAYAEAAQLVAHDRRLACEVEAAHQLLTSGYLQQGSRKLRELFTQQGMSFPESPTWLLLGIARDRIARAFRDSRKLPVQRSAATPADRARIALYRAAIQGLVLVDPIRAAFCVGRALRLAEAIGDPQEYLYFLLLEGDLRMSETAQDRTSNAEILAFDDLIAKNPAAVADPIITVHKAARTYMNMRGSDGEAVEALGRAEVELAKTRIAPWELVGGRTFLLTLLRRLGRYAELRQHFTSYLADARRRNDVYSAATMRGFCNLLYLTDDEPARAHAELSATTWISLQHGFHVQHWYDLNALMEYHLYIGEAPSAAFLEQQLTAFRASRLARLAVFDVETEWLLGRIGLAFPETFGTRRVRTAIRRLERTTAPYPRMLAAQLRAGLACTSGDRTAAAAQLRVAAGLGRSLDQRVQPAIAHVVLASLDDRSEQVAAADKARATLAAEGIRDVARFASLMMPGFAGAQRLLR